MLYQRQVPYLLAWKSLDYNIQEVSMGFIDI